MNWNAIGAIGEILGALAVAISLLYLAVQIRQNSRTVKGASVHNITQTIQAEQNEFTQFRQNLIDADIWHGCRGILSNMLTIP